MMRAGLLLLATSGQALQTWPPAQVDPAGVFRFLARISKVQDFVCVGALYRADLIITTATYLQQPRALYRAHVPVANASQLAYAEIPIRGIEIHHKHTSAARPSYNLALVKLVRAEKESTGLLLDAGSGGGLAMEGWGEVEQDFDTWEVAMQVPLLAMDPAACSRLYRHPIDPAEMCAGSTIEPQAHYFDNGSPLFYHRGDTFYLLGLYSWSEAAGQEYRPNVFTKVGSLGSWIDAKAHMYDLVR